MYRKPVYSTSVQKTSSKYKCTERNVQGQTLHINLYCTTIEYHTDGTSYLIRNVQGQTHIKNNFNFVQWQTLTHSDKATWWIIELLTSQLKTLNRKLMYTVLWSKYATQILSGFWLWTQRDSWQSLDVCPHGERWHGSPPGEQCRNQCELCSYFMLILISLDFDNKQTGGHTDTIQTEVLLGANVTGCEVNCPFR